MRALRAATAWLFLPLGLWACGGPSASAPSPAPPIPAPTVASIAVTGTTPAVGGSSQFAAAATFSDGASRDVTSEATWQSTNPAVAKVSQSGIVTVLTPGEADIEASFGGGTGKRHITVAPPPVPAPVQVGCDASLWNHVYTPSRLKVVKACQTVLGTIAAHHKNEDGDIDVHIAVDPAYASLLNAANVSQLNGLLQTEAICEVPPRTAVATQACQGFTGSVRIPPDGTRVQVTGTYVKDTNHGWMEIHPISDLRVAQ